jgi:hypothetical protein
VFFCTTPNELTLWLRQLVSPIAVLPRGTTLVNLYASLPKLLSKKAAEKMYYGIFALESTPEGSAQTNVSQGSSSGLPPKIGTHARAQNF